MLIVSVTYWRRVAEQNVSGAKCEEPRPPALPRLVVVEHTLVHPAHVLDPLSACQTAVVQLHLQVTVTSHF
jgi:hypothetical protein